MGAKVHQPNNSLSIVPHIVKFGDVRHSERGETVEIIGEHLIVRNPLHRLDVTRTRKMNPAFAFAEFIAMLAGINDIKFFQQFIPSYDQYSSDGKILDGAYGARILSNGKSQIDSVIKTLAESLESRRAVIAIYDRADLTDLAGGKNTPCTLNLQFLVDAEQKLSMIAYMRSSDIYLGLPNDIAAFTLLQEYVAMRLSLPLGNYHHMAGSLHFYKEHGVQYKADVAAGEGRWPYHMNMMSDEFDLNGLVSVYENIHREVALMHLAKITDTYSRDMALTALAIARRSDSSHANDLYSDIKDATLRRLVRFWIVG